MNAIPGQSDRHLLNEIVASVGDVLLGKRHEIKLALCCLLAKGHLLVEDFPGMGKTTLAQALANVLGLSFRRIQFTSDLLPSDIIGIAIYERSSESFRFHPGPIFTQLLLADEINRTSPKTQSALLEAMAEGQVTSDGESRPLPKPFFVIATQNPVSQGGTYPLPESQQDRFAMCISLGYPDAEAEKKMLLEGLGEPRLNQLKARINPERLVVLQNKVTAVHVSDAVVDYLVRLVHFTREMDTNIPGLSPRASQAILQCAKAWATLEGRGYLIPEDIQAVFSAVAKHRLQSYSGTHNVGALVDKALNSVDIL